MPYRMPAEWHCQSATWLSWPHNLETWPENLVAAQEEFVAFASAIANVQSVKILAAGDALRHATEALSAVPNIELIDVPTNDAWARDYAPTFVRDSITGDLVVINWHYNAWGGKYPPYDADQQIATRIGRRLGVEIVSPDFCFEGGAVEVNESGVMLCTTSCALAPNRNPGKTRADAEAVFYETLGVESVVWLRGDAIEGDDTDGHIDQLARYVDDQTIVYAWSEEGNASQRSGLAKNLADLKRGLAAIGRSETRLIPLVIPKAVDLYGRRVPASYCNFVICNGLVIVPQFGDTKRDSSALATLVSLFSNHRVIGLDSVNLSVGLGSFHCLSQQQPAV